MDLPHLTIAERTVLSFIAEHPTCSNSQLAGLVGMSLRGVEALVSRLIRRGHLRSYGKGRARRLELTFPVEHHTECGDSQCNETHSACGDDTHHLEVVNPRTQARPALTLEDDYEQTIHAIAEIVREPGCPPETPYRLIQPLITRIENDLPECPDRKVVLDALTYWRDTFFAACYCTRNLPKQHLRHANRLLLKATPEQLAQLRQRIEAGQLSGRGSARLLVDYLSNAGQGGDPAPEGQGKQS